MVWNFAKKFFLRKFQKVLSNSEDLKIKNWLIEETNNEDEENDENEIGNNSIEQVNIIKIFDNSIINWINEVKANKLKKNYFLKFLFL